MFTVTYLPLQKDFLPSASANRLQVEDKINNQLHKSVVQLLDLTASVISLNQSLARSPVGLLRELAHAVVLNAAHHATHLVHLGGVALEERHQGRCRVLRQATDNLLVMRHFQERL